MVYYSACHSRKSIGTMCGRRQERTPRNDISKGRFDPKRGLGTNVVLLEPDAAKAFPNDEAVNKALRLILKATKIPQATTTAR